MSFSFYFRYISLFSSIVIQVLSVTLDKWSDEQIDSMIEVGGNSYANTIYEAFLPKGYPKPNAHSSYEERAKFIRYLVFTEFSGFSKDE